MAQKVSILNGLGIASGPGVLVHRPLLGGRSVIVAVDEGRRQVV